MKPANTKPVQHFSGGDVCDNPAIICRVCFQYCSAKNPCIPVNGDDTCLTCLKEAVALLEAHVVEKETADDIVRGVKTKEELQ